MLDNVGQYKVSQCGTTWVKVGQCGTTWVKTRWVTVGQRGSPESLQLFGKVNAVSHALFRTLPQQPREASVYMGEGCRDMGEGCGDMGEGCRDGSDSCIHPRSRISCLVVNAVSHALFRTLPQQPREAPCLYGREVWGYGRGVWDLGIWERGVGIMVIITSCIMREGCGDMGEVWGYGRGGGIWERDVGIWEINVWIWKCVWIWRDVGI